VAKKLGMALAYHNHSKEFGNSAWEFQGLLRLTDPNLVGFLLDAGHAFRGGADVPRSRRKELPADHRPAPGRLSRWQAGATRLRRLSKSGESAVAPAIAALRQQFP
jgi:hypothetical protein